MIIVASILSMLVFAVAFKVTGIYPITLDVVASVRKATGVITDHSLDDQQKEALLKQSSIHLLKRFMHLTMLGVLILSLPILVLLALDALNIAPFQETLHFLGRWEVVLATIVGALTMSIIRR